MDFNKKKLKLIKEVLKSNPRGMTVTTIAREISMNSHSVGRYLEVLAAAGHVDMTVFGRSKVYYLSQRLPVSAMLSLSSDIILILDKDLRIVNANERFFEFTRAKRDEVINRNVENISFPLKFTPEITPYARGALNGDESKIEAYFNGGKEGLHFNIKLIPTVFDDGEKGVTIIFEDITERKKIETERSFLAAIVESSNDAIISMTLDGIITSWNTGAERLYGYSTEEMKGRSISKLASPGSDEIPGLLEKIKHGERIENYETLRMGKDGRPINVSLTVSPIIDASNNIIGVSSIHHDITRHIQFVKALGESEQKFRVLTDSSQVAIAVYQDDTIVYVNPATLNLSGYTREDLLGKTFWDFVHPDHRELMKNYWLKRLRGEKVPERYEIKIIEKGEVIKWTDCFTAPLEYNGRPAILVTLLDITERKQAEEMLKDARSSLERSLRFTEALLSSVPTPVFYKDITCRYLGCNRAFSELMGVTESQIKGKTVGELWPSELSNVYQSKDEELLASEVPQVYEYKVKDKDGVDRPVIYVKDIFRDENDHVAGIVGTFIDITERKRAEEALRDSEEMFHALTDSSRAAIIVYQVDTIVYVNQATLDLSGYTKKDLIGTRILDFIHPEHKEMVLKYWLAWMRGEKVPSRYELKIIVKDGGWKWADASIAYLEYGGKPAVLATLLDITGRKRAEDKPVPPA